MSSGSTSPRSAFSRISRPPFGIENGLWQNSSSPDSSPISYIGKSTIQQNSYRSVSMWPGTAVPSFVRSTPAAFCAAVFLPAVTPTKQPGFRLRAAVISAVFSVRNFAMPPAKLPCSSTLNQ